MIGLITLNHTFATRRLLISPGRVVVCVREALIEDFATEPAAI